MVSRSDRSASPSIAVIVPNRNDARFLLRCLDSVLGQEVLPDELIIVDDCSTDDSVSVIQRRIAGESRARLIVNPVNLGAFGAYDVAWAHARSEYVLPLASNDFVLPGLIARAKSCFARFPGIGIWSAMSYLVDESDGIIRLHPSPVVALDDAHLAPERCAALARRVGNWFTGPTIVYSRDALAAAGGFHAEFKGLSDMLAALMIACRWGAAYSPLPLGAIRMHGGGLLSRTLGDNASLNAILDDIRARGPRLDPELFTESFLERLDLRVRFSALNSGGNVTLADVATRCPGLRGAGLMAADRVIPKRWRKLRLILSFLLLRPFDLFPTLWYRYAGSLLVRFRLRLGGVLPARDR